MSNDIQKGGSGGGAGTRGLSQSQPARGNNGILPTSFKTLSSYLRIVSAGASTVASTMRSAASAASAMVDRECESTQDQVCWAGFDKLELEGGITRQALLLTYSYCFQVWDVEEAENVQKLISRHDGAVSFMQLLPKPTVSEQSEDKFADSHPLLILCTDGSFSGGNNLREGYGGPRNGSTQHCYGSANVSCIATVVWFYSLKSQSYVHLLRFRSVVHLVRCSSRVVAVLQSSQIHCFDSATLERQYTILTNPVVTCGCGSGGIGFGPLAVGPRWIAYSGTPVAISNSGRVSPQHLTPSASFPSPASNGGLVAHYAKESSKQLAAGIVTLGDMGYKKLSRYYSELVPDGKVSQSGSARVKVHDVANCHLPDADSVGMVIVRDIVRKSVVAQFRAHKSPISSLCFDPSGTLLVTASVQGHNLNVFRIMPELSEWSSGAASGPSYVHLYRLQRGLTNAVIQDISFSKDSQWIMISSSRGTSHLFAISPSGGLVSIQSSAVHGPPNSGLQLLMERNICISGPPITLSALSRIRNGNNGWRNTVSGAAAAATGKISSLPGAIASTFHNSRSDYLYGDTNSLKTNYYLLVFSPTGCVIQYALHICPVLNGVTVLSGATAICESGLDGDASLSVKAIQKWNICQMLNREQEDYIDMYRENINLDSGKVFPERMRQENSVSSRVMGTKNMKDRITSEEKHHMYISEAELQMHQNRSPLWAKPEIKFHSMLTDGFTEDEESVCGGEIEIEKIPVHVLEARPKHLVPVFDHFQRRIPVMNGNNIGQSSCRRSDVSEDGTFTSRSSSSSVGMMANDGIVIAERCNGAEVAENSLMVPTETSGGDVNTNGSPIANIQPQAVHTRENSASETQFNSINSNIAGLKTQNQFEDESDEFD